MSGIAEGEGRPSLTARWRGREEGLAMRLGWQVVVDGRWSGEGADRGRLSPPRAGDGWRRRRRCGRPAAPSVCLDLQPLLRPVADMKFSPASIARFPATAARRSFASTSLRASTPSAPSSPDARSSSPLASSAPSPSSSAGGRTTHFGFKTVPEAEKESLGMFELCPMAPWCAAAKRQALSLSSP